MKFRKGAVAALLLLPLAHGDLESRVADSFIGRSVSRKLQGRSNAYEPLFVVPSQQRRQLEDMDDDEWDWDDVDFDDLEACDQAFMACLSDDNCVDCFSTMQDEGIDWAGVTSNTPCTDVVKFLNDGSHCRPLKSDQDSKDMFCGVFNTCVVWDDDDSDVDNTTVVDCDALTECNWDGFHPSFIGNGVCNHGLGGCYNTKICNYDGGDCCEDTCDAKGSDYMGCGRDGYFCKNPDSENCDVKYTSACPGGSDSPELPKCASDESIYRIVMYDSFGDGWDDTVMTISPDGSDEKLFTGGLSDGSQGTEFVCLKKASTCYNVELKGGIWGIEVAWEIRPFADGSPTVADGGAPTSCTFSVGGGKCDRTCSGKPTEDPTKDPDYTTFKELYECITDKCVVQVGACNADASCRACFDEDASAYCYSMDNFNAVINCGMCQCTERKGSVFCENGITPGPLVPKPDANNVQKPCTPAQTLNGTGAVLDFSKCTDMDQLRMMVVDFDNDNFGALDTFEACAHSYKDESNHGGHTALGCMQILTNAMTNPKGNTDRDDAPLDAIKSLATSLYEDAEDFCDCAKKASDTCPLCPSFMNFKVLMYEILDACQSLDEIDCAAWGEFYSPCKDNLRQAFNMVDFTNKDQCDYVKTNCGGAGPFPAFRRLDCEKEGLSKTAWDWYREYSRECLHEEVTPSDEKPKSSPTPAPTKAADGPTPKPYTPSEPKTSPTAKPYVPPEDKGSKPYTPSTPKPKKKSHFFRNFFILLIIAGAGFYYYKRRNDGFSFVRYRQMRNYGGGESEMYSGLAMEGSTSFEPPTLPPTPSAIGGDYRPGTIS